MDVDISIITSLFVQALLYGTYITTVIHCLRWLIYTDGRVSMLTVSITVFLLQTTVLATSFKSTLFAQSSNFKGYDVLNAINTALEYMIYQIVDAVLIYRCWIVYSRVYKVVCLLAFLWVSSVALSGYTIYLYANTIVLHLVNEEAIKRVEALVGRTSTSVLACNIAINIYATTAIVYRILQVTKNSVNRSKRLHRTWRIVAESGALYTTSSVINLAAITVLSQNPLSKPYRLFQVIVDAINMSMAGIAFNLILIRVGQQRQQETVDQDKSLYPQSVVDDGRGRGISAIRFRTAEATDSMSTQNPSIPHSNMDHQGV
ncbi:hypothetical protein AX15_005218 [Amanita polypyramis BW_CC]|nr:hypothetical protein AX15_005218 [Amanita polypyramis BW_CC]